jgi:hypothetical protein
VFLGRHVVSRDANVDGATYPWSIGPPSALSALAARDGASHAYAIDHGPSDEPRSSFRIFFKILFNPHTGSESIPLDHFPDTRRRPAEIQ